MSNYRVCIERKHGTVKFFAEDLGEVAEKLNEKHHEYWGQVENLTIQRKVTTTDWQDIE